MPIPQLPPEALRISQDELVNLVVFDPYKQFGGLEVAADEAVQATGWDPTAGEDGLVIPAGSRDAVILHAPVVKGVQHMQHQLVLAGTYVALHAELRERSRVVGVTFEPMARLAVSAAGFSHIQPFGPRGEYQERLEQRYGRLRLAGRRPFKLAMVHMPTELFIDTFANKRLGRDASALIDLVITGEPPDENGVE